MTTRIKFTDKTKVVMGLRMDPYPVKINVLYGLDAIKEGVDNGVVPKDWYDHISTNLNLGLFYYYDDGCTTILLHDDATIYTLIHECIHAAVYMCDYACIPINMTTDEVLAYHTPHLVEKINKVLKLPLV